MPDGWGIIMPNHQRRVNAMRRSLSGSLLVIALVCCRSEQPPATKASSAAAPVTRAALTPTTSPTPDAERRRLTVALYPYVPHPEVMFADAKRAFEKEHPEVEVVEVNLFDHYYKYDSKKNDSIIQTTANVMEIDSVFLDDLASKLTPLPASAVPREGDLAKAAVDVAKRNGIWLGSPHWLCSDFVFTTKAKPFTGLSLKALEQFVGHHPKTGAGLLADIMGSSTLGELYLDEVVDRTGTLSAGLAALPPFPLPGAWTAPGADVGSITRLLDLCDADDCRRNDYHNGQAASSYEADFAHKRGVALVGYSEATYEILHALKGADCASAGSCIASDDIVVAPLPLADRGVHPFVWVDTLAINKESCTGTCLDDAAAFIAMMNDDAHLRGDLLTALDAPRYLLPAKVTLDDELRAKAPLYDRFRSLTRDAPPALAPRLGETLRAIGDKIDAMLPKPSH